MFLILLICPKIQELLFLIKIKEMIIQSLILFTLLFFTQITFAQEAIDSTQKAPDTCYISVDTYDEFDSTRMIATQPIEIGFLVPTKNLAKNLQGEKVTDEAKAIFSYAEGVNNIRSFFLTLSVVEHKYLKIENGFNVTLKMENGQLVELYNVTDRAELNKDIIMWMFQHTLVIPLEAYHILKNEKVEKIRINYDTYKRTIDLETNQQESLQNAVRCIERRLKGANPQP